MAEERILADAALIALPFHHLHGVVQDTLDQEVAELGHQHVRLRKMANGDRQAADVIVMTMRDRDGIHVLLADQVIHGQGFPALPFGMNAGVHEQPMTFEFDEPRRSADIRIRIEVDDPHGTNCDREPGNTSG